MKLMALSIRQPWASLIAEGVKDVENRTWPTSRRGPFLIHAAKKWSENEYAHLYGEPSDYVFGAIIGIVDLVGCVTSHESEWFEGPHGLILENPRVFENPIPYEGALGFFSVDIEAISDAFVLWPPRMMDPKVFVGLLP
jgi:hypothetical protein